MNIVEELALKKKELDQRLSAAMEMAGRDAYNDASTFLALYRMNCIASKHLSLDDTKIRERRHYFPPATPRMPLEEIRIDDAAGHEVIERAIKLSGSSPTVGAGQYVQAIVELGLEKGDKYIDRPFAIDMIVTALGFPYHTSTAEIPGIDNLLKELRTHDDGIEDFQYLLALEGNRMVFRVVSTVNDFVQANDSGLLIPQRTLLTHLGGIGLFTHDEVAELEDLINDRFVTEQQFQIFFELHPHFLRKWDHRDVFPHVYLSREAERPLVPDFILTNAEAQDAAILDLKRTLLTPRKTLVRRQSNRMRFADVIQEAAAQLRTYRRWFEVPEHRTMLKSTLGMEIYNPRLMVVIGRSSEFRDGIERATLRADNPDIEVVTYDDILRYAQDRMIVVRGK